MTALRAGAAYFAIVFAAGFVFGTIRILLLIPKVGETIAVLIELPVMLTVAWIACGWLVQRFAVPDDRDSRITMGVTAFGLLMAAEFLLAYALFGFSPRGYVDQFATLPGFIGLAGQTAFGSFPALQARMLR